MTRFVPTYPARAAGPVASWRGFVGERARTAVAGWSERMFELPYYRRKVLTFRVHVLMDPALIEHVVLTNAGNYAKLSVVKVLLGPVIGRGLLTADGDLWREQRRIVAASFSPAAVEQVRPVFGDAAREAVAEWRDGELRDLAAEATRTTMLIIAESLFSGDPRLTSEEALRHIAAALEGIGEPRLQALLGLPMVAIGPKARAGAAGQRYLRRTLAGLVDERLAEKTGKPDFLGTMISALSSQFAPDEARTLAIDNAATFYLAGHETTSNALAWTLYLLSEQPAMQDVLAQEAAQFLAEPGGTGTPLTAALPKLYAVLQEALRLYPPAPRFDRQAQAPDVLPNGERVGRGDIVSIWPWLVHRHKRLWQEPDAFDPSRFLPDRAKPHRYAYLPFGAGPRICVGAHFATVEALSILANWLRAWRFHPSGPSVEVAGLVTMRPRGGLPLRLERRSR